MTRRVRPWSRSSSPASTRPRTSSECVRRALARRWPSTASPARSSSPTTAPRTAVAELAAAAGARVVHEPRRGYGSAYLAGFAAARGEYIVMADADLTYDFARDPALRRAARRRRRARHGRPDGQHPPGRDAVAAPLRRQPGPHRHPQPLLPHRRQRRPLRHARASAATSCRGSTCARPGMEFASEMVIRASKEKLDIREFPIEYHPRGGESQALELPRRLAPPALPARPQPDATCSSPGRGDGRPRRADRAARRCCSIDVFGRAWDLHTMIAGALLMIVGVQVVALGLCAHAYGTYFMGEQDPWFDRMRARFRLEHGLLLGGADRARRPRRSRARRSSIIWIDRGFGALSEERLAVARRDADHRRPPDLLLVVPALDPRPAPPLVAVADVVTVAIPVRNGGALLDEVLAAVRAQRSTPRSSCWSATRARPTARWRRPRGTGPRSIEIAPASFSHGGTRNTAHAPAPRAATSPS